MLKENLKNTQVQKTLAGLATYIKEHPERNKKAKQKYQEWANEPYSPNVIHWQFGLI